MYLRKSNTCSYKLDVQETKLQFHTVLVNLKLFLWDAGLCVDGIPALDLWDLVLGILHSSRTNQHG